MTQTTSLAPASTTAPPRWAVAVLVAACGTGVALCLLLLAGHLLGVAAPVPASPFGVGFGEGAAGTGGLSGWIVATQAAYNERLVAALGGRSGEAATLLWVSLAYGAFHAAGPGHGKAVVSAYLMASGADLRRGLAVSTAAAFLQAVVAIALVLVLSAVLGVGAVGFRSAASVVESASFALVAAVGAWLLVRKSGDLAARLVPGAHDCGPNCGHLHAPPPAGSGLRTMAGTVMAAGMRPCSGAILVLVYALSRGMPWTGVASVLAMAAGTAATTGAVAAVSVYAKSAALRFAAGRGRNASLAIGFVEVVCCAVVMALGFAVLVGLPGGFGALLGG